MTKDTGGPAFPIPTPHGPDQLIEPGMTLRDWFAGQATDADVDAYREQRAHPDSGRPIYTMTRAQARYSFADAMIAQRAKD